MTHNDCIRNKPWLKLVNTNNITERLLRATSGNAFVVWNNIQQSYELHTIEAYRLSGDSYNTSIPIEALNEFLINDYRINDFSKNYSEVVSAHIMFEHNKESRFDHEKLLKSNIQTIERVLGTNI